MKNKILTNEEIEKKCSIYKDCQDGSYEACCFYERTKNEKIIEKKENEYTTICPYCFSEAKQVGEDGIDVCSEDCGIIEGSAITVNELELERLEGGESLEQIRGK